MKNVILSIMVLGLLLEIGGCAGQNQAVPIALRLKPQPEKASEPVVASSASVVVTAFSDDRSIPTRLGTRKPLWGASQSLVSKNGPVGEVIAKRLVEYLTRQGWQAHYAPAGGNHNGNVVISGKVLEGAVDAQGSVGSTEIVGKNKIVVHAKNASDGSSITDTISHTGSYSVFWFSPDDAEELLGEVMEKNFEKFVAQTKFEGTVLKFR